MPFRLASLLRLREHQRDLCQMYLAEVLDADRKLVEQGQQFAQERVQQLAEMAHLTRSGPVPIDSIRSRRYHAGQLTYFGRQVEAQRILLAQQIELCRQALLQADQRVKALEKLREQQVSAELVAARTREDRQMEEAWQALHWREGGHS